ncbi:MAG: LysM peptidoglycan-binding domain-containing protein, partial [Ruminococcaceae bacterium]|nr:LysM peptidoglycan-binding domain-containing protein [Oscillospiraceae bacterium]
APAETPVTPAPAETPVAPAPAAEGTTYVVAAGDCLWNLAYKFYGTGSAFGRIAQANGIAAPYVIYVGQVLTIPAK